MKEFYKDTPAMYTDGITIDLVLDGPRLIVTGPDGNKGEYCMDVMRNGWRITRRMASLDGTSL